MTTEVRSNCSTNWATTTAQAWHPLWAANTAGFKRPESVYDLSKRLLYK